MRRRHFLIQAGALPAALSLAAAGPAWAQATASRVIVPYAPGAATDALARLMAQALEGALGGTFIVENKAGGGTQIGTKAIATAPPDGHTLGFVDTAFVINPGLFGKSLPYDTRQDFVPLSLMATAPFVLLVHHSVRAASVQELVALAKSKPDGLNYGSAGIGSAPHLAGEQLRVAAGIPATHVPYRGGSTVLNDMIAGHIDFGFTTVPTMIEHIRAGTLRALAVTGPVRAAQLPQVPTMAEAGLSSVDASPLFGLVAPAGMPAERLQQIGQAASSAVKAGPLNSKLTGMGFIPVGSTPAEFKARIEAEIDKWSRVIAEGRIKPNT
ncbi:tripartite tricarboxylate transporter substrate binding protein [Aquincola agrisoli]|uniref:tripartite tricarboxylate transporter substrate binding protein n=1 Tax=Aquincola agrisoli TaxID=3119538 RepID=UPI002FBEEFC9